MKQIIFILSILLIGLNSVNAQSLTMGSGVDLPTGSNYGTGNTIIDLNNPATSNGTITRVDLQVGTNLADPPRIGIFYQASPGVFMCRAKYTAPYGMSSSGYLTVSLNVVAGDFIGVYIPFGTLVRSTTSGSGYATKSGDFELASVYPYPSYTCTITTPRKIGIYGTGTGVSVGKKWNGTTIIKWNEVTPSKINGI